MSHLPEKSALFGFFFNQKYLHVCINIFTKRIKKNNRNSRDILIKKYIYLVSMVKLRRL